MATVQVNEVVGTAWLVNADGSRTQVQQGMQIADNAKIITENGAQVVLSSDEGLPLTVAEGRELALSAEVFEGEVDAWGSVITDDTGTAASSLDAEAARVIAALAEGVDPFEELDATAATLDGGGVGEDGSSFTRLASIIETTTPLALAYPRPSVAFDPQILGGEVPAAEGVAAGTPAPAGPGAPVAPEVGFIEPEAQVEVPVAPVLPEGELEGETPEEPEIEEPEEVTPRPVVRISLTEPMGVVDEEGLFTQDGSTVHAGSFGVSASDGIATVTIAGTVFTLAQLQALAADVANGGAGEVVIDNGEYKLTITDFESTNNRSGTVKYEYELLASREHEEGQDRNTLTDTFELEVQGNGGRTAKGDLVITVVDDIPTAVDIVMEDALVEESATDTIEGNIFTDSTARYGADEAAADVAEALVWGNATALLNGEEVNLADYGTLTQSTDGSGNWSFVLDNDKPATQQLNDGDEIKVSFDYTLEDRDGDTSTATIDFTIEGKTGTGSVSDATHSFDEAEFGEEANKTTSGSLDVSVSDSISAVVIGGVEFIVENGQLSNPLGDLVVDTPHGEIKITDYTLSGDGKSATIEYSYTVSGAQDHDKNSSDENIKDDSITDTISVVVKGQGATVSEEGSITVTIEDDVPNAEDFKAGTVKEDDAANSQVGGNVFDIDGVGFGEDGRADVEGLVWGNAVATLGGVTVDLADYGRFETDDQGGWSFVLDNDKPATQQLNDGDEIKVSFDYTLEDRDGDTSTATIDFTIEGKTGTGSVSDATHSFDEAEFGDEANKTTSGSLDVSVSDSISAVVIGGVEFIVENGQLSHPSGNLVVDTPHGQITIGSYTPSEDGKSATIEYSYTVSGAQDHDQNSTDPNITDGLITDTISVVVKGQGDTEESGSITVTIKDDVPVAKGHSAGTVTEEGDAANSQVGGNVFDIDGVGFGEDGRADTNGLVWGKVVATLGGATVDLADYGRFETDDQGGWSFVLDNDKPATQQLNDGDEIKVSFDYTLEDRDGDTSTATIDFTIEGKTGTGSVSDATHSFDEAEFGDEANKTTSGSLDVSVSDSISAVVIGGVEFIVENGQLSHPSGNLVVNTPHGQITIDNYIPGDDNGKSATIEYSYTVSGAQDHDQNSTDPNIKDDSITDTISVVVKGQGDTEESGSITVTIEDDTPVAKSFDATGILEEDGVITTVGNNVLKDIADVGFGADGRADTNGLEWGDVVAKLGDDLVDLADYGRFETDDQGGWSFVLDNTKSATQALGENEKIDVSFEYTLKDKDGDTATATITFDILGTNDAPTIEEVKEGELEGAAIVKLSESGLTDGIQDGNEATKATQSGKIEFSDVDKNDTLKVRLSVSEDENAPINNIISNSAAVVWTLSESGQVLTGKAGDDEVITVHINDSGEYTVTLHQPVQHSKGGSEDNQGLDDLLRLDIGVHVSDGKVTTDSTIVVTIEDDAPTAVEILAGTVTEDEGNNPTVGGDILKTEGVGFGADDRKDFSWTDPVAVLVGGPEVDLSAYGEFSINDQGVWSFTLDNGEDATQKLSKNDKIDVSFTYTLTDKDGDTATETVKFAIQGTNDAPVIEVGENQSILTGEVIEKGESNKDDYKDGETNVVSGRLVFTDIDSDGHEGWRWNLVDGRNEVTEIEGTYGTIKLENTDLDNPHNPDTWEWVYTLDNTKTATQELVEGQQVEETFPVRITDQHGASDTKEITVTITGTNDAPKLGNPEGYREGLLEDGEITGNMIKGSGASDVDSDLVLGNKITVGGTSHTLPINNGTLNISLDEGVLQVSSDGSYTFTPTTDYSGPVPKIEFTIYEVYKEYNEGVLQEPVLLDRGNSSLTLQVTPVADKPTLKSQGVETDEDEAIQLKLVAPEIKDSVDKSAGGVEDNYDNPERIGAINIAGFKGGDVIEIENGGTITVFDKGKGKVEYKYKSVDGEKKTFDNSFNIAIEGDNTLHPDSITSDVIWLSKDQYEKLTLNPKAHDGTNRKVTVKVSSYEVDSDGKQLSYQEGDVNADGSPATVGELIPGAESTQKVTVDIKAVTDDVFLDFGKDDDGVAIKNTIAVMEEDSSYNIKDLLKIDFEDLDGSEKRSFEISGLPIGAKVGNTVITKADQVVKVSAGNLSKSNAESDIPNIIIHPPKDFSGVMDSVTVTLKAYDTDADSFKSNGKKWQGETKESFVTINFEVTPGAGDVAVDDKLTIEEDTSAFFMKTLEVTDKSTDAADGGKEEITSITIKDIPEGWELRATEGGESLALTPNGDTFSYTISNPSGEEWKNYTLTPPLHSSEDATVTLFVTSKDTSVINGVEVESDEAITKHQVKIEVTPVAEQVDDSGDLTMTDGYDQYDSEIGKEDQWFALNVDGKFELKDGWSNQDGKIGDGLDGDTAKGSEDTYAILTPDAVSLANGDTFDPKDAQFRYKDENGEWKYATYGTITADNKKDGKNVTAEGFKIPAGALDTVEFMAPKDVAGQFEIKVQAYTEDFDEDAADKMNSAISGEALLGGIIIKPDADAATLATQGATGYEDSAIALDIRTSSTDKSETFNVKIGNIPAGSIIVYDGNAYEIGAKGTLTLENFDSNAELTIQAPKDSNENFTLKVEAQSVDEWNGHKSLGDWAEQSLHVKVKGVADEVKLELVEKGITEQTLDAGNSISLSDIITSAKLEDGDGSETLSLKITGLPEGFNLIGEGAKFMGGGSGDGRSWVIDIGRDHIDPETGEIYSTHLENVLNSIGITTPEHFSGKLPGTITPITTENDGHSKTGEPIDLNVVTITPSPESELNKGDVILEDEAGTLDFSIDVSHGDTKETLTAVRIKASSVPAELTLLVNGEPPVADKDGFYVITGDDIGKVTAQAAENFAHNEEDDTFELEVHYEVTNTSTPGYGEEISETTSKEGTYTVTVTPVTDEISIKDKETLKEEVVKVDKAGDSAEFELALGNNDNDGSERLTKVELSGVPAGAILESVKIGDNHYTNVIMTGMGNWVVYIPENDGHFNSLEGAAQGLNVELAVKAGQYVQGNEHEITVTVTSQDTGATGIKSDNVSVNMQTEWSGPGEGEIPELTVEFDLKDNFAGTEDESFALGGFFGEGGAHLYLDGNTANEAHFSIVLGFPEPKEGEEGVILALSEELKEAGVAIRPDGNSWVISGKGQDLLEQVLAISDNEDTPHGVTITPPKDWNSVKEDGSLDVKVTLNGYLEDEALSASTDIDGKPAEIEVEIAPVTDPLVIGVEFENAEEGEDIGITINLKNMLDSANTVEGVKVKLTGEYPDGTLSYNGVSLGVPDENGYYTIPVDTEGLIIPQGGESVSLPGSLTYTPAGDQKYDGGKSFGVEVEVTNQEGESSTVKSEGKGTTEVAVVNNGYEMESITATGTEYQGYNEDNGIPLTIVGGKLLDASESVQAVVVKGLPNGFLVLVDGKQVTNAGEEVGWSIPLTEDGEIPENITVLPPLNWSGEVDAKLVVISGEETLSTSAENSFDFKLEVAPVADGVQSLQVAPAIGKEGEPIDLNLNLTLKDGKYVSETDATVERATVILRGLGAGAVFYVGDLLIQSHYEDGAYVLAGLSQAAANDLKVVQAASAIEGEDNEIQVKVTTQEYDRQGNPVGEVSKEAKEGKFTIMIQPQEATGGNDLLLYFGEELDGKGGYDTVYLRPGETLNLLDEVDDQGNTVAGHFKNIEAIDLSRDGHDNIITGLGQEALDTMFKGSETPSLTIIANEGDTIKFKEGEDWIAKNTAEGEVTFTSEVKDPETEEVVKTYTVTVKKPKPVEEPENEEDDQDQDDTVVDKDSNYDGEPGLLPEMDEEIFGDLESDDGDEVTSEESTGEEPTDSGSSEGDNNNDNDDGNDNDGTSSNEGTDSDEGLGGILTKEDMNILDNAEPVKTAKPNFEAPEVYVGDSKVAEDLFKAGSSGNTPIDGN